MKYEISIMTPRGRNIPLMLDTTRQEIKQSLDSLGLRPNPIVRHILLSILVDMVVEESLQESMTKTISINSLRRRK